MMAKRDFPTGGFLAEPPVSPTSAITGMTLGSPFSKRANMSNPTLRHLTLKQLLSCEQPSAEGPFMVDSVEISQILVCGCVRRLMKQPSSITLTIEDGTGSIEARKWFDASATTGFLTSNDDMNNDTNTGDASFDQLNSTSDDPMMIAISSIKEGSWVRIVGNLRSFANKKSINIYDITPITDFNLVIYHMTNCLYGHLYYTRQLPSGKYSTTSSPTSTSYSNVNTNAAQQSSYPTNTSSISYGSELSPQQQLVLNMFIGCTANEGLNIDTVCKQLRFKMTELETKNVIEWLIEEGHLYSTIDCNHAKSTAG